MTETDTNTGTAAYQKPELTVYGRVLDLTQGSSGPIGEGDAGRTKRPK